MTPVEVTKSIISYRVRFQGSIDRLGKWCKDWQLLFKLLKLKIMHGGLTMRGTSTQSGEGT